MGGTWWGREAGSRASSQRPHKGGLVKIGLGLEAFDRGLNR